jgi:hypothetical protein
MLSQYPPFVQPDRRGRIEPRMGRVRERISLLPELCDSSGVYCLAARIPSGVRKDKK